MNVILAVTFHFVDVDLHVNTGSGLYEKTINMPVSPVGLDSILSKVGNLPVHIDARTVSWSEAHDAFIVGGMVSVDQHHREKLEADENWLQVA